MEAAHIVQGRGLEVLDGADAGALVGMGGEGVLRDHQAEEAAVGVGQHALAQLFLDHAAFRLEVRLVHHQRAHALGLGPDQPLQVVGRDDLVVGGGVVGGEGVVGPAHVFGEAIEALGRQVPRGLEHHVFEQVRETRPTLGVVLGADAVPNLHRHVRRGAIHRRVELQPVGKGALLVGDRGDLDCRRGRRLDAKEEGQNGARQGRGGADRKTAHAGLREDGPLPYHWPGRCEPYGTVMQPPIP